MPIRYFLALCLITCGLYLTGCPSPREQTPEETGGLGDMGQSVHYIPMDAPDGTSRAVVVEGVSLVHTTQIMPMNGGRELVGEGDLTKQIDQVFVNLQAVLKGSGTDLDQIIKMNIYVDALETADLFLAKMKVALNAKVCPTVSVVITPLPCPGALVAVDAVATCEAKGEVELFHRVDFRSSNVRLADVSVAPVGGIVFFSGQPDKTQPRSEAANSSLSALLEIAEQLDVDKNQILQIKVFIDDPLQAEEVLDVLDQNFPDQAIPPVIFVKWTASAPIEIEMIAHLPLDDETPDEPLTFYTPPGVEASPKFSRVALVETDRLIFIGGLTAQESGDGETQVRDVFSQLESILNEMGGDMTHLVKATYYVTDSDASDALGLLRPEYYDPARPPAASLVRVDGVAETDRTVTMDMIAVPGK